MLNNLSQSDLRSGVCLNGCRYATVKTNTSTPAAAAGRYTKTMSTKYILLLILLFGNCAAACSPALPEIVPPAHRNGEFTYIYPPTHLERLGSELEDAKDIAVIKVSFVWPSKNYSREYSEVEILFGWGYQKGRLIKLHRTNYLCGEFVELEEGEWYVALMEEGIPKEVVEYRKVKNIIEMKGKPEYVYTSIGLIK